MLGRKKRNVLAGNGLHGFTSLRVSNPALFSAPNKASKGQVSSPGFQGLVSRAYVPAARDEGWVRRALSSTQRRQTGRGERQGEWGRRAEERQARTEGHTADQRSHSAGEETANLHRLTTPRARCAASSQAHPQGGGATRVRDAIGLSATPDQSVGGRGPPAPPTASAPLCQARPNR